MDQSFKNFKVGTLAFALVVMMTACSSSQPELEDGEISAESVVDVSEEATTDAVPDMDPSIDAPLAEDPALAANPAPEVIGSEADMPPMSDPAASDMNGAVADMPPMSDPNLVDPGIATAPAPVENTIASTSSLDLPKDDSFTMEPAPMTESGERDYLATPTLDNDQSEVIEHYAKKKKRHKKGSRSARHSVSGEAGNYAVKRGDTLMKIAFENYGDLYRWREIYEANRDRIQDPNNVPPGTQLVLNGAGMVQVDRNGEQYLIHHGETLGVISKNVYGTPRKWKKLWENNRELIKDPNKIYAGFYLYYQPEGKLTNGTDPAAVEGEASNVLKATRPVANTNNAAQAPRSPASSKQ